MCEQVSSTLASTAPTPAWSPGGAATTVPAPTETWAATSAAVTTRGKGWSETCKYEKNFLLTFFDPPPLLLEPGK